MSVFGDGCERCGRSIYNGRFCSVACARSEPKVEDRPMAAAGLISYRYLAAFGFVMIGARDHADALREAQRSVTGTVTMDRLQVWNETAYVDVGNG